jgi:hypothetical protein
VWYALGAAANDTLFALYLDGEPFDPRDVYILRQARWVSFGVVLDFDRDGFPETLPAGDLEDRGQPPARLEPFPPVVHAAPCS